jgi:hypothetical protein
MRALTDVNTIMYIAQVHGASDISADIVIEDTIEGHVTGRARGNADTFSIIAR